MKIRFLGAAGEVTGSQHLIETSSSRILLDCGLFQGSSEDNRARNERFRCTPQKLDAVVLSHAHIDHCGNLPGLFRAGFRGPIYATPATCDIASVMLRDSARIQEEDARYASKKLPPGKREKPLYTEEDAKKTSKLFEPVEFHNWFDVSSDVRAHFRQAGHILGAAIVELDIREGETFRRVVFSGDLGRRHQPLLVDPETIERCDVLICESTYGNRLHDESGDVKAELARIICNAARKGGKVIIPAFSLGRTQMLVYLLNDLRNNDALCRMPVYVDSPLSARLTDIHREHSGIMDQTVQETLSYDDDVFDFPGLRYVHSQDESMALNRHQGPCVIIAAGGMCEGGRVVHHLKHSVSDDRNTVLIIGFQAERTLGRRIVERQPELRIYGKPVPLKANVEIINGLSAHADAADFRWWFDELRKAGGAGQVYLVHGEAKAAAALAEIAQDCSDLPPVIPEYGDSFEF